MKIGNTGYSVGNLYIKNEKHKIPMYKPDEKLLKENKTFLYDEGSGNVHYFPENPEKAALISDSIFQARKNVIEELKKELKKQIAPCCEIKKSGVVKINGSFQKTNYNGSRHIFDFVRVSCEERNYDLMFIRFKKNEGKNEKTIDCTLKCIQIGVVANKKSINMYPTSMPGGVIAKDNINFYYNPQNSWGEPKEIAKTFLTFIDECENSAKSNKNYNNVYVLDKNINGKNKYIIMLKREANKVEIYKRIKSEELRNYYSLRGNFSLDENFVYLKCKEMKCAYGGVQAPTPRGIFNIKKVSNQEYISHYYDKFDNVKFFGYLVIFEDYFIHSDLYKLDVSQEMIYENAVQAISKEDKNTSGCIRVAQEDLDWLVSNIEIGTTVIM